MLCLSFLVEACSFLLERAGTVGLFRKPGSLPRIKTLRVRFWPCRFHEHNFYWSNSTIWWFEQTLALYLSQWDIWINKFCHNFALPVSVFQAKLNSGEGCLPTALPYDVATLIKQFCRELPEPLFPSELHTALLRAQALSNLQDRTSALQLLSCLLPARNSSCLHYLFDFLSKLSQRFDRI